MVSRAGRPDWRVKGDAAHLDPERGLEPDEVDLAHFFSAGIDLSERELARDTSDFAHFFSVGKTLESEISEMELELDASDVAPSFSPEMAFESVGGVGRTSAVQQQGPSVLVHLQPGDSSVVKAP